MKKSLLILGVVATLFSCNQNTPATEFKTAYVDTAKLSKEYEAFKDLESQGKVKEAEMGRELDDKVQKLKLDYASAQHEAATKGPQWAQQKAQELQKREREIGMMQETMMRQLQTEFGTKNDSAVSKMKRLIKDYGKEKGYDYIYGTGDIMTVLYAKEGYDITDEVIKMLNDEYKETDSIATDTVEPAKEEAKK